MAIHLVMKHVELLFQPIMEYKYCHSTSVHTARTLQNVIHCQFHHQSFVQKALHVQHMNCTVTDLVTSSPVYNDLSQSDIVLPYNTKLPV